MQDTSEPGMARYFELLRERTAVERLAIASRLTRAVRELAKAAIVAQEPSLSPREIQAELAARLYGPDVSARLFPRQNAR